MLVVITTFLAQTGTADSAQVNWFSAALEAGLLLRPENHKPVAVKLSLQIAIDSKNVFNGD